MDLPLTTPALLFPAIAILMLGYINRYIGTANVIRTFKKDYDAGYVHTKISEQLLILKHRIELSRIMVTFGLLALAAACMSMYFLFLGYQVLGSVSFALSVIFMVVSLFLAARETHLSNKSLIIEIDDILTKERKK